MSIPLAELTTADLDAATLDELFADIANQTTVDEVLVKGAATAYAGTSGLDEARSQFLGGARGLQIRYRWQGEAWWDTLVRLGDGRIRLVRTRAPA
jgi:hypothetical protein